MSQNFVFVLFIILCKCRSVKDIRNFFSNRIGGYDFDKAPAYKFSIIKNLKDEFKKSNEGIKLLDFGIGEPDSMADQSVINTMKDECGKACNRFYADSGTFYFLKEAANYMQSYFSVSVDPTAEILHSIGSKSALSILAGTLINNGDVVLSTTPGYPIFDINAKYFGANVLSLPLLQENEFLPDIDTLSESQLHRIKIISINYPNNPTGANATHLFFQKIVFLAKKYGWLIINDAAYAPLAFDLKPLSILQIDGAKNVAIELHSMSKGFNMTGWRLGWIASNHTVISAYKKYKDTVDSGQFLAIQKASIAALKNYEQILSNNVEKYTRRASLIISVLNKFGFCTKMPKAGFFIYASAPMQIATKSGEKISFQSANELSSWLLTKLGIVCVPWDEAGPFLRFSLTFEANSLAEEMETAEDLENRLMSLIIKQ